MKSKLLIAALGLGAVTVAGAALADRRCDARVADWQPRSAVVKMAEDKGWQVERIHIDDGCYALRVTDAQGQRMKVMVDPATLAVVATKQRGDGHGEGRGERRRWRGDDDDRDGGRGERRRGRDDDDDERGAPRQGRAAPPADAATPSAPAPDGGLIGKPKAEIR